VHKHKLVRLIGGIFTFFLVTYLFFDLMFGVSGRLEAYVQSLPATVAVALVIILLLVADILIPIPASIVMVVSGMLFGGWWGGMIALIGSITGSVLNFQISRRLGRTKVEKWLGEKEYSRLSEAMRKYGGYFVILSRSIPLVMESTSAIAGISKMKLKDFFVMNLIGFTPIIFLYSYAGQWYRGEPQNVFLVLVAGFFVPLGIWGVMAKLLRNYGL
jgi:uncharacterized membrane protein YdjX (TVP38/TMEM64 family)